jgi:hypothetical protein
MHSGSPASNKLGAFGTLSLVPWMGGWMASSCSAGGGCIGQASWAPAGPLLSTTGEIFGHNRLRSYCLQVQPVTCKHHPVFLYWIGVYSINSFKMIGNFHAVLNFHRLFLKLNRFIQSLPDVADIWEYPGNHLLIAVKCFHNNTLVAPDLTFVQVSSCKLERLKRDLPWHLGKLPLINFFCFDRLMQSHWRLSSGVHDSYEHGSTNCQDWAH